MFIVIYIYIYIYISRGIAKNKEWSAKNGSNVVLPKETGCRPQALVLGGFVGDGDAAEAASGV